MKNDFHRHMLARKDGRTSGRGIVNKNMFSSHGGFENRSVPMRWRVSKGDLEQTDFHPGEEYLSLVYTRFFRIAIDLSLVCPFSDVRLPIVSSTIPRRWSFLVASKKRKILSHSI